MVTKISEPTAARRKLVVGNWKMNGNRASNAELLAARRVVPVIQQVYPAAQAAQAHAAMEAGLHVGKLMLSWV